MLKTLNVYEGWVQFGRSCVRIKIVRLKGQNGMEGLELCEPRFEILARQPPLGTQVCILKGVRVAEV
jgi:hypothetical protein